MSKQYRIEELYPNVKRITIRYRREYFSAFGLIKDQESVSAVYQPSFECNFVIECINRDCTQNEFDLCAQVGDMIINKETQRQGKLRCQGHEAKDHSSDCPCMMEYEIEITYI